MLPGEVPKSSTSRFTRWSKTSAVLQSGQKVTATGVPATSSFTISCQTRIWIG
jgi:hypothetical protein